MFYFICGFNPGIVCVDNFMNIMHVINHTNVIRYNVIETFIVIYIEINNIQFVGVIVVVQRIKFFLLLCGKK